VPSLRGGAQRYAPALLYAVWPPGLSGLSARDEAPLSHLSPPVPQDGARLLVARASRARGNKSSFLRGKIT